MENLPSCLLTWARQLMAAWFVQLAQDDSEFWRQLPWRFVVNLKLLSDRRLHRTIQIEKPIILITCACHHSQPLVPRLLAVSIHGQP